MKTDTIFFAEEKARSEIAKYWNARNDTMAERRMRQFSKFYAALLRRIEAGDRAREALRMVEWYDTTLPDYPGEYCPWCDNDYHDGHAPDCPRQIALGLQEVKP